MKINYYKGKKYYMLSIACRFENQLKERKITEDKIDLIKLKAAAE